MSRLRDEEAKRKKSAEATEVVLAIGEEGKKGVKAAKEYFQKEEEKELKVKSEETEKLYSIKGKKTYNAFLADLLKKRTANLDDAGGWTLRIAPDDIGVVMELESPDHRFFRSAFRPVGDPGLDTNAIEVFAYRAQNTIDSYWKVKSGIFKT